MLSPPGLQEKVKARKRSFMMAVAIIICCCCFNWLASPVKLEERFYDNIYVECSIEHVQVKIQYLVSMVFSGE